MPDPKVPEVIGFLVVVAVAAFTTVGFEPFPTACLFEDSVGLKYEVIDGAGRFGGIVLRNVWVEGVNTESKQWSWENGGNFSVYKQQLRLLTRAIAVLRVNTRRKCENTTKSRVLSPLRQLNVNTGVLFVPF